MDGTKTAKKIVTEYYCKQTMTFINEPNVNCCTSTAGKRKPSCQIIGRHGEIREVSKILREVS